MIWDFSKLESLELPREVATLVRPEDTQYIGMFLRCVKPEQFPQLRKFSYKNDLFVDVAVQRETDRLMSYFIEHLKKLEDLDITSFGSSSSLMPYY
jgi:hypothetical protein